MDSSGHDCFRFASTLRRADVSGVGILMEGYQTNANECCCFYSLNKWKIKCVFFPIEDRRLGGWYCASFFGSTLFAIDDAILPEWSKLPRWENEMVFIITVTFDWEKPRLSISNNWLNFLADCEIPFLFYQIHMGSTYQIFRLPSRLGVY